MFNARVVALTVWVFTTVVGASEVFCQTNPDRPIRIVTGEPGGGTDFASRLIAQTLTGSLGPPVIVENRAGTVPAEIVARATPDGCTLLVDATSLWVTPFLRKTSYDAVRDFSPITLAVRAPNVLLVHPSAGAKSVKELLVLAQAKPGLLNYGSAFGGSNHLSAELFKAMANINVVWVPYKGTAPALNGLIGGEVQLMFASAGAAAPHVKSGKVRALAVTTIQPSALYPGVPTLAATVPGYESVSMTAVFAPAKTPVTMLNRVNQDIVRALNTAELKERFFNVGVEIVGSSRVEASDFLKADMAKMHKVIKDANIKVE